MSRYGNDFDRGRGGMRFARETGGGPAGYDRGFRASQQRGYDPEMRGDGPRRGPMDDLRGDGRRHREDRGRRGADWIHEGGMQPGGGAFYANRAFSLRDSGYAAGTFFGGGYTAGGEVRGGYDRDFARGYDRSFDRGIDRGRGRR